MLVWHGSVLGQVGLISKVAQRWVRLVLGWVTVCGRINHLITSVKVIRTVHVYANLKITQTD